MRYRLVLAGILLSCVEAGCSSNTKVDDGCDTGAFLACFGDDGCVGERSCVDGEWGDCVCGGAGGSPSGGAAGSGGEETGGAAGGTGEGTGGSGGGTGGEGAGGNGGGAGGSVSSCPATHQCVPRPPDGWSDPVLYGAASALVSCSGDYPDEAVYGGTGVAGDRTCTCNCDATPVSSTCTLSVIEYSYSSTCSGTGATRELNSSAICQSFSANPSAGLIVEGPEASCATGSYSSLPAAAFDNAVRACGGGIEEPDACSSADEMCLPAPPGSLGLGLCVYAEGLQSCPPGFPNEQTLVYASWQDTRSCPASCACSAQGGECSSMVNIYGVFDCGGGTSNSMTISSESGQSCLASGGGLIPLGVSTSSEAVCTADSAATTASGQVTGADPITVCCTE